MYQYYLKRSGNAKTLLHELIKGHKTKNTSDHGQGWGNAMDWNLIGEYLPE